MRKIAGVDLENGDIGLPIGAHQLRIEEQAFGSHYRMTAGQSFASGRKPDLDAPRRTDHVVVGDDVAIRREDYARSGGPLFREDSGAAGFAAVFRGRGGITSREDLDHGAVDAFGEPLE